MSKTSKSALLEQEAMIQAELRAENEARAKAEAERVESEKRHAEAQIQDRLRRESASCWCGVSHLTNERMTLPRSRSESVTDPIGSGSSSVFIGNLPFEYEEVAIRSVLSNLLGETLMKRFRLVKEPIAPACDDAMDDNDFFWSSANYRPRHRPTTHKGIGFLLCRNETEARAVIETIRGHELLTQRRKLAIRASFARPKAKAEQSS